MTGRDDGLYRSWILFDSITAEPSRWWEAGASVEVRMLPLLSICAVRMRILAVWNLKLPYEEALLDIITLGIFAFLIYLVF